MNQAIALALRPPDIWIVYTIFCSNTRLLGHDGTNIRGWRANHSSHVRAEMTLELDRFGEHGARAVDDTRGARKGSTKLSFNPIWNTTDGRLFGVTRDTAIACVCCLQPSNKALLCGSFSFSSNQLPVLQRPLPSREPKVPLNLREGDASNRSTSLER